MKTKLSLSVLFLVGLAISITIIHAAEAEDPRVKMGLAALWTFDKGSVQGKDVEDAFGKNSGTITGKPDHIDGFRSEALDFDGAVDLIRMGEDIFFPSVTMEAIIKPTLGTRNPIYDNTTTVFNCLITTVLASGFERTRQTPQSIGPPLMYRFPLTASGIMSLGLLKTKSPSESTWTVS